MPRIAIIHIMDDHTAEDVALHMVGIPDQYRLVGVYDFPARSELKCAGCTGTNKRQKMISWGRHQKGFMVCAGCGSRNLNVRRWFVGSLFDWFGANLLGRNAPGLFRTPAGYGPRDELTGSN